MKYLLIVLANKKAPWRGVALGCLVGCVQFGSAKQVVSHLDEIICGAGIVQCHVEEFNTAVHEFLRGILADFIGIHFISPGDVDTAVCIVAGLLSIPI